MLEVDLTTCPPLRLVGIRHVGPYTGIADVFGRLATWAKQAELVGPGTRFIGIYYDNPRDVDAAELRSDACITIDRTISMPDDVHAIELPGGRHAVVRHLGSYADLPKTYDWIFSDWFPKSGKTPSGVAYEDYVNDATQVPADELITDIYIPVAD